MHFFWTAVGGGRTGMPRLVVVACCSPCLNYGTREMDRQETAYINWMSKSQDCGSKTKKTKQSKQGKERNLGA